MFSATEPGCAHSSLKPKKALLMSHPEVPPTRQQAVTAKINLFDGPILYRLYIFLTPGGQKQYNQAVDLKFSYRETG